MATPKLYLAGVALRPYTTTATRVKCSRGVLVADQPGSISNVGSMGYLQVNGVRSQRQYMYVGVPKLLATDATLTVNSLLTQETSQLNRSKVTFSAATLGNSVLEADNALWLTDSDVTMYSVECDPLMPIAACQLSGMCNVRVTGSSSGFVSTLAVADNAFYFSSISMGDVVWPSVTGTGVTDGLGSWIVSE